MIENDSPETGLTEQIASLRRQISTLLLALIVVSGTLTVYLWYQSHTLGREIDSLNQQVIQPFDKSRPTMSNFVHQLEGYGNAHPDFQPILKKYGIGITNYPPKK
ncbi:MAG TPA: hypothetical protein VMD27_11345 [Candidatus Aquilonibacter sp.]|nr:hypothetical protein [Candidatus Aquilonibacter sp.]